MDTINLVMAALFFPGYRNYSGSGDYKPIKLLWKLLINSVIGLFLLMLVNYIGQSYDFGLPINIITVLVAGFLGIPGLLLLICFRLLL